MINLDNITNENNKEHNKKKWAIYSRPSVQNFDNWWFWIRKNKRIANLINEQSDVDKIYLYAKDLNEQKYEYLIKNHKNTGIKHLNDPNAFVDCSNTMDDIYENINDYNPTRKEKS